MRRERGNFFFFFLFFRARVFVALSRRRRYHRRVVKIGDKSLVDSLQKIFSFYNVHRVESEHVVGLIKRIYSRIAASFSSDKTEIYTQAITSATNHLACLQYEFRLIVQHLSYSFREKKLRTLP